MSQLPPITAEDRQPPRNIRHFVERMIAFQTYPKRGQMVRTTEDIELVLTALSHQVGVPSYNLNSISDHLSNQAPLLVLSAALRLESKEFEQLWSMAQREYKLPGDPRITQKFEAMKRKADVLYSNLPGFRENLAASHLEKLQENVCPAWQ